MELRHIRGTSPNVLDFNSGLEERSKQNTNYVLAAIYFGRAAVGVWSLGLGLIAAFSYCGPLLVRMSGTGIAIALRLAPILATMGKFALEKVAVQRTLWLIRVARFNLIGFAITAGEIIYHHCIKDDELENWCQACTFRRDKTGSTRNLIRTMTKNSKN